MKLTTGLLLAALAVPSFAAEKGILHCFAFTPKAEATDADFQAYYEATEKLAKDYKGIKRVWYGKLRAPLNQVRVEADSPKKFSGTVTKLEGANVSRVRREHGACMEFKDAAAWDAYGKSPEHDAWVKVYEKVRVDGTTTYQILPTP
jgi:hypothetical protein